ncbi:MAG: nucleoside hydrolase [Terracidiphilus sp.]|jgi:inosine-uridine nucleoside N-ribohydrolase
MKNVLRIFALTGLALATFCVRGATGQPAPAAAASPAPQLVLIDTDIGDDIDDAFALALALRSPELRILGVTTTFGDTELRARLVERYLAAVGQNGIPVAAGPATKTDNPMTQAAYARQAPVRSDARRHPDAVAFLLDQIRRHPGEITLIAIGPLFNVQAAIARDPATFRKLRRVVMMGGSIDRGYDDGKTGARRPADAEWNISRDPAGARALLGSGVPVFMMPLDSTQIRLGIPEQGEIYVHGSQLTDQLTLLYHEWTGAKQWRLPTLFDPVAVAYTIRPGLCPVKPMRIEVDDKGFTRPAAGKPNVQVCLQSNEKEFLRLLLSRMSGE